MAYGTIKIKVGQHKGKEARVYSRKNEFWMDVNGVFSKTKIHLDEELASIDYSEAVTTSAKGVIGRAALAGLAGSTRSRGMSWALAGAASSVNTQAIKYQVTMRLRNGDLIGGETTPKVIEALRHVSPNRAPSKGTGTKVITSDNSEKMKRFIDDAPRTILEVEKKITALSQQVKEAEELKENGETFDIREKAAETHSKLLPSLQEQEKLHQVLQTRIKADEKYGSMEQYEKVKNELTKKITKLEKKNSHLPLKISAAVFMTIVGLMAANAIIIIIAGAYSVVFIRRKRDNLGETLVTLRNERENLLTN